MTAGEFADDEKTLAWAEKQAKLLAMRGRGVPVVEAAAALGIHPQHAFRMIKEAAREMRENSRDLVRQRFTEHDARLEWLYRECVKRIEQAALAETFDHNALRAAVAVLERQARLLGLDKDQGRAGPGKTDWLDEATPADLVKEAERLGLRLPKGFKTAAGVS